MKPAPLASLAVHFALLSLAAIGGANAVVPDMQRIAVLQEGWMSDHEFADFFALANAAPGPNVLIVSLIGYKIAGIGGALVATVAMCGPSSLLCFTVSGVWDRFQAAAWRERTQRALAPITIGLLGATGYLLSSTADDTVPRIAITFATCLAVLSTRINPLWLFGVAAVLGLSGI